MGSSGSMVLIALSIIGYLVGLGGIIAGMLTQAWIVRDIKSGFGLTEKIGLIKTCTDDPNGNPKCNDRSEILKFKDGDELSKEKDVVLVMLIVSVIFSFIAILVSLSMICMVRGSRGAWKCGAIFSFLFGLFAVIAGIAGLAYAESEFKDLWASGKHGWSNIICWVGCGGMVLGVIMAILMIVITPMGSSSSSKNTGVHYVGNRNPTYQHDYKTNY